MSQVTFYTEYNGKRVEVLGGWDRPLQHFFLTVLSANDDDDDDDGYDYVTSIEDSRTTHKLREKLDKLSIKAPEEFWSRIERKEGNVTHKLCDDGAWNTYNW
jgi:hypothetical protein